MITYVFAFISVWYFLNIVWLIYGFKQVKTFEYKNVSPITKFSIIVPFRNEEEDLPKLLQSISLLNYPSLFFEVILVDDDSDFRFQVSGFRFQISIIDNIRASKSPKKDAISTAISIAKNDWIITTDADCLVSENWLSTFDAFIQENNPKMIAAGVSYHSGSSFLDAFQTLDFLSLQGTTIGSFGNEQAFMCNGANFCYQKKFFKDLNGFIGNENIASGDDVFLLQKAIATDKKNVHFLNSAAAIVETKTESNWKILFNQRVRWASKTNNYSSFYSKQLAISVFLLNLICVIIYMSLLVYPHFLAILLLLLKFTLDYILLAQTALFFKKKLSYIFFSSLFYPIFCVCVAVYSIFGKYTWKNRQF